MSSVGSVRVLRGLEARDRKGQRSVSAALSQHIYRLIQACMYDSDPYKHRAHRRCLPAVQQSRQAVGCLCGKGAAPAWRQPMACAPRPLPRPPLIPCLLAVSIGLSGAAVGARELVTDLAARQHGGSSGARRKRRLVAVHCLQVHEALTPVGYLGESFWLHR